MDDVYFLYLHGYKGSPGSVKAVKLFKWLNDNFQDIKIDAPLLNMHKESGFREIKRLLDSSNASRKVIFGTSLGGYLAHLLKQTRSDIDQVILINPAVRLDLIVQDIRYAQFKEDALILTNMMPEKLVNLSDYLVLLQDDDHSTPSKYAQQEFSNGTIDIKSGQGHHYDQIEVSFSLIKDFLNI